MIRRPKLGIALGSGSARGWAHIGVLLALAEHGIAPDFIAGCSMGAMVGAAFAAGRIGQLETWALSLDWKRVVGLLDLGLRGGLIKGERLLDMFQGQFVECQFSELALPFAAVATDLATGKELWLREGKVSDAVRASCTVPGLFQPVLRDGRYVVDGSVVNPIPVSLCRAMGAEVVIAVDLGSHMDRRFPLDPQEPSKTGPQQRRLFNVLGPSKRPEKQAAAFDRRYASGRDRRHAGANRAGAAGERAARGAADAAPWTAGPIRVSPRGDGNRGRPRGRGSNAAGHPRSAGGLKCLAGSFGPKLPLDRT